METKKNEKNEMRSLARKGDVKIEWDINNTDEVDVARSVFDQRIEENWSAFRENIRGERGDRIKIFDPRAERIILVPPISGGS